MFLYNHFFVLLVNQSELFENCIGSKHRDEFTITARSIYDYSISPFIIWCDYNAPKEERDLENPYMNLLGIRSRDFRKKLIESKFGINELDFDTFRNGFRAFLDLAFKKVKVVANVPLYYLKSNLFGICDVLVRNDSHSSVFGSHHYNVIHIKNAKRIRHQYIVKAAFYNYLLGMIQDYTPDSFFVMTKSGKLAEFSFEDYKGEVVKNIHNIRSIQKGKSITPTAKSCKWPWNSYCTKMAVANNDVSIIPMIGKVIKEKLNNNGIFTVNDLFNAKGPLLKQILDVPDSKINKIFAHALAYINNEPQILQKPNLKYSDVELFIDFEGTDEIDTEEGNVKVDYLIGVLVNNKGKLDYHAFFAESLKDELKIAEDFFKFVRQYNCPIYHYGPYEKIHLNYLKEKLQIMVNLDLVDLLSIVRKCTAFPTISQSLKDIAKYLKFQWRNDTDAQESIVLFLKYLETGNPSYRKKILEYNEDDVRATLVVKQFLDSIS